MLERLLETVGRAGETAAKAVEAVSLYPEIASVRRAIIGLVKRGYFDKYNKSGRDNRSFRETFITQVQNGDMDEPLKKGLTIKKKRPG